MTWIYFLLTFYPSIIFRLFSLLVMVGMTTFESSHKDFSKYSIFISIIGYTIMIQ